MSVQVGMSLPDTTHARTVAHARNVAATLSGLSDTALRAELRRCEPADHEAMLTGPTTPAGLHARAGQRVLSAWKSGR